MNRYKLSKAGVDANEGIRRFNNDKSIYERFLYTFPDDKNYGEMLAAIEAKDVNAAFRAAHSLKGVSGNLSLITLHANLIPLVELLRSESLEDVDTLLAPVKESYDIVVAAIKTDAPQ